MTDGKTPRDMQGQPLDFLDLVTHIPVGVCKFLLDEHFTVLYANRAFYTLYGYTPEQFEAELHNGITWGFPQEERAAVTNRLIAESGAGESAFRVENRIVRRNGQIVWVLASGSFTTHNGHPAAHGVVVDITEQKEAEERLRINEERFRLALAQTDSTIFDYDIAAKVMMHADKAAEKYGLSHETHNVPDCLVENQIVHPDSAQEFLEMYRRIREGEPAASCVIKAKTTGEHYIWQKISMTNIYNHKGVAVRAVGMLEDIDKQTRREAQLLEQSQRDSLTGLYNKKVTESRIQTLLQEEAPAGALFIIDLDNFKVVNDRYGHQFGDLVLMESARRLQSVFRKRDIIGRIGGDEFFAYMDGAYEEKTVLRKANEIRAAFEQPFSREGSSKTVTCTVGAARCPVDGLSFDTLYRKADVALYEAKRNGKNQICLSGVSAKNEIPG